MACSPTPFTYPAFFIALKGIEGFGFFLDNPAKVQFDFGALTPGRTVISQECGDIVYYVFLALHP